MSTKEPPADRTEPTGRADAPQSEGKVSERPRLEVVKAEDSSSGFGDSYGFQEQPFHVTPDAKMVFAHRRYEEALSALNYAVMKGKGFAVITGEVGTGKTTLLRHYVSMLEPTVRYAVIFNTWLGGAELLAAVADDLGIDSPAVNEKPLNRKSLLDSINEFLIREFEARHAVVVFIDEAQNLSVEALESLRMLSNLETDSEKLIQIVLLGQPELQDQLAKDELWQLRSRIAVAYHLSPMDEEETGAYIAHRIAAAKPKKPVSFTPRSVKVLHRYSGGCPRIINIICDQCLIAGAELRLPEIDRDIVESVIGGFEHLDRPGAGHYSLPTIIAAMVVVIVIGAIAGAMITTWNRDSRGDDYMTSRSFVPSALTQSAKPSAPAVIAQVAPSIPAEAPPTADAPDVEEVPAPAPPVSKKPPQISGPSPLRRLVASFHMDAPDGFDRMALPAIASVTGLTLTEQRLSASTIELLGLPAILMPGNPVLINDAAAIISRSENGMWTVETLDHGSVTVPAPPFSIPVSYFLPKPSGTPRSNQPRRYISDIASLQKTLTKAGHLTGAASGRYDRRTREAVKKLQASYKIPVDGVIGPATALALYAEAKKNEAGMIRD